MGFINKHHNWSPPGSASARFLGPGFAQILRSGADVHEGPMVTLPPAGPAGPSGPAGWIWREG